MTKFKRGILIDSESHTVRPFENTGLESLQKRVGGYIERAFTFPTGETCFVDEEGLLKNPQHFFFIGGYGPFAGNGVIVGPTDPDGDELDCAIAIENVARWTHFSDRKTLEEMGMLPDPHCTFKVFSRETGEAS